MQTAVSALVGDRLTVLIQVVTKRQSLLSRPSKMISWSASPSELYVFRSESTPLEQIYDYATLYKRLSSYPSGYYISYSFIYIIQKSEFQDIGTEIRANRGLESGETEEPESGETGEWILLGLL